MAIRVLIEALYPLLCAW